MIFFFRAAHLLWNSFIFGHQTAQHNLPRFSQICFTHGSISGTVIHKCHTHWHWYKSVVHSDSDAQVSYTVTVIHKCHIQPCTSVIHSDTKVSYMATVIQKCHTRWQWCTRVIHSDTQVSYTVIHTCHTQWHTSVIVTKLHTFFPLISDMSNPPMPLIVSQYFLTSF